MALLNALSYTEGPYARVTEEHRDLELEVEGELPPELCGAFLQNSANPQFEPSGPYHWFDGDGMVHGVAFREGRASYRNRWVRTPAFLGDRAAGRRLHRGILEPFDPARYEEADPNTANTDLVWHGDKLLALWWLGGEAYQLGLPELETVGPVDFAGTLPCGISAHAKVDPRSGELVFFDYNPYRQPYLSYGVASAAGRVVHHTVLEVPAPSLYHDIAITERYTIFMDFPMVWDAEALTRGKRKVRFHPERPGRFGILPRHAPGSEIRWFEVPACYCYHSINAWEERDAQGRERIVLLACRIENPIPRRPHAEEPNIPRLYFLRMHPFPTRWTFELATGAVQEEALDDVPSEFPRVNDRRLGERTRYAYHPRVAPEQTLLFDGFLKYDFEAGGSQVHAWGEGCVGGETVFAPRPGAGGEDDGWVLAYVTDRATGRSEVRVVDARQPEGPPQARVRLPRRVPFGFHAEWVDLSKRCDP